MQQKNEKNSNWNAFLFISFWLAVAVEFVGLFIKNYYIYGFARVLLVPILLLRVLWSPIAQRVSVYVYLFLIFSMLADLLSIFGNEKIAYIGLNLFTVSYLSICSYFNRLNNNYKSTALIIFFIILILIVGTSALRLNATELSQQTFYLQLALHTLVLVVMTYSLVASQKKISSKSFGLFFLAVIIIIITNALFAIDNHFLNWRYPIVESLIGLGNGCYLFMITRGALRNNS